VNADEVINHLQIPVPVHVYGSPPRTVDDGRNVEIPDRVFHLKSGAAQRKKPG
jgi:hypothetical protein